MNVTTRTTSTGRILYTWFEGNRKVSSSKDPNKAVTVDWNAYNAEARKLRHAKRKEWWATTDKMLEILS